MYPAAIHGIIDSALKKVLFLRRNPWGFLVSAMLAGVYVGIGVLIACVVGGPFSAEHSPWTKLLMGGSFSVALSLVVFAGAELFTSSNMIMPIAWWERKSTFGQVVAIWLASWGGNLLGGLCFAALIYLTGVLNSGTDAGFVQTLAVKKTHLSIVELLTRGAFCNMLVCLASWCAYRMKSEVGRLIMIFWCLYVFVAAGFEHSVANMTLLTLALFQAPSMADPHAVTVLGMGYNLLWVSLGNIIGGMLFVGAAYWTICHKEITLDAEVRAAVPVGE